MLPDLPFRRRVATPVAVASALAALTAPAAAHGTTHVGEQGLGLPVVFAVVTATGTVAGLIAVGLRRRLKQVSGGVARTAGIVLIAVGATAVITAGLQRPPVGVAGVVLGVAVGAIVAMRGDCGLCADATVGAVAIHRLVEGLSLAAVATVGSTVGGAGVLALSAHTVAECIAIGGRSGLPRRRAVGAVLAVQTAFVVGTAVGAVGLLTVPAGSRLWLTACVGGPLIVFGLSEAGPLAPFGPLARPSH